MGKGYCKTIEIKPVPPYLASEQRLYPPFPQKTFSMARVKGFCESLTFFPESPVDGNLRNHRHILAEHFLTPVDMALWQSNPRVFHILHRAY